MVVKPAALWGLSSVNLLSLDIDKIDSIHMAMVASMMRLARAPLEGWLEWFIRTRVRAREFLVQEKLSLWSNRYYRDFFCLAHRIRSKPNSLACRAHLWR
eukprot:7979213-Heterocapsa_arctica.AAC.1